MGHLTSAVHWWEDSQMRVLVLGSLVVQFLLLIFTLLRTRVIPGWIRLIMWLAYLGGDAIAIYALATLFNRHKDGSKSTLEVVWAPILLIHLGGHDGITAYNIEDNELWSRHLLTALSQVTVAIYVFCKSWPTGGGDKRLLQAAIVLFVPGVLKCFAKPWALKKASIKSLVSSPTSIQSSTKETKDMKRLEEYVQRRQAKASVGVREQKDEGEDEDNPIPVSSSQGGSADIPPTQASPRRRRRDALHGKQNEGEMDAFERYVKGAMAFVREEQKDEGEAQQVYPRAPVEENVDHLPSQQGDAGMSSPRYHRQGRRNEDLNMILHRYAYMLFVDLSCPYHLRLSIFRCFWTLSEEGVENAYGSVRQGLANAFNLLYTKLKVFSIFSYVKPESEPSISMVLAVSRFYLPWAAIGLFHHSHREDYSGIDVKITYALFCCTAVLEIYSHAFLARQQDGREWPQMVAQYNLMEYFVRSKKHSITMWISSKSGCKDFLDQHWCMDSCFSSGTIAELVLQYLKAGWKEKIHDPVSYRRFNDNRGQCALEGYEDELGWTIKRPFDESVLIWHIATDLIWHRSAGCKAVQCRQMSNYMVYLLFVNPEMLLPGTRRNLFTAAYDELKVRDDKLNPQRCCHCQQVEEKDVMETLIKIMQDKPKKQDNGSEEESKQEGQPNGEDLIHDAWDLAQGLLKLRNDLGDEKMWEVIKGVWVEMLCFSASRCRGYLHAKALGSGGEFLSYVWLLLFYMGMETFMERLQREREELPSRRANSNGAPLATDAHSGTGTASSSTSMIHRRGASSTYHLHTGASTSSTEDHIIDMHGLASGARGG